MTMAATATLRTLLLASALVAMPGAACANGWPQPRGEGRVISSLIYSESPRGFDGRGNVVDIDEYRQFQLYLNGEYGLTDDLTLLLTPSFRSIEVENQPERDATGLQFLDVGARYRVAGRGNTVVSVQAKTRIPLETFRDTLGQVSIQGVELDLRGQVGHGFTMAGLNSFAIAEAGYTFRGDDPPNEFDLDLTLGARVAPRVMVIGNLYNTFSDGRGRNGFPSYRYHNLLLSGVYDVTDTVALQLGVLATIDGKNALRERGLVAGLWVRF